MKILLDKNNVQFLVFLVGVSLLITSCSADDAELFEEENLLLQIDDDSTYDEEVENILDYSRGQQDVMGSQIRGEEEGTGGKSSEEGTGYKSSDEGTGYTDEDTDGTGDKMRGEEEGTGGKSSEEGTGKRNRGDQEGTGTQSRGEQGGTGKKSSDEGTGYKNRSI